MTGRFVRILLCCLLALALASPSFAARRSSLAGNLLIQDKDDIFIFPQHLAHYNRSVSFDFGTNNGLGSGGMIFGNDQITFGAFSHRGDFWGAIPDAYTGRGDIDNISSGGAASTPVGPDALNWIDALFGWQLGDNPWGARVSVGRGSDDPNGTDQASSTGFNVVVGTQIASMHTDVSGEFSFLTAEDVTAAGKQESTPFQISVAARRTAGEEGDALALGWLGEFSFLTGNIDNTPTTGTATSTDFTGFQFVAGAGPVYKPNGRTNVAMYGTVELSRFSTEDAASKDTETTLVIPGWHIATEVEIASWLQARAGLISRYAFDTSKTEPVGGTSAEDKANRLEFGWTSGVGVQFGNFHVDGYFDPSVLTNATSVFGSQTNRLFGMLSAGLTF